MYTCRKNLKGLFSQLRQAACGLTAMLVTAIVAPAFAADLTYTTGGITPWFSQAVTTHDGVDAQQSGAISHSQSSWLETTVTGPGAIRFWWKVSSESCCDPLTFSIDGTSLANIRGDINWQAKAFAVPAGSHTLRWTYSTDGSVLTGNNAGWVDEITFEAGTNIDVTSPVTTATPGTGTYAAIQNVSLTCSDTVGCTGTFYCQGSGCVPTTAYSGPLSVSTTTELRYYSTDAAGNNEDVKTTTYTFDTTPPTSSVYPTAGNYEGQRTITIYCNDSGMGCSATYYCLGSGCTPSTQYTSPVTITTSTDLRYYSIDRSGNSEAIKTTTYTISPDTTPPTTTPGYPSGTYGPRYFYLNCSDNTGSGCATTYYCLGTGCTPTTVYGSSIQLTTSTDLRFYSQDKSGNSEVVQTASYVIDQAPPVTTANPPGGSYDMAPLVTLTCSDGIGTGCSNIYYCLGQSCTPTTRYQSPVAINETTVLRYYSTDSAGNNEAVVTQSYAKPGQPKTIAVPASYATIQSAIDAAYNGDTVLVAPGTYVENINFKGKNITVTSSDGPDTTIIDGNKAGSVVTFSSGESASATLSGFTIRNGVSDWRGGGVLIDQTSPTILNNKVIGNSAHWGAGIAVNFASPTVRNNIIAANNNSSYGGGIHIGGAASAQIIDNTISDNSSSDGGGISLWAAGTPLIKGNVIKNNRSYSQGGGIWSINSSNATVIQNLIVNNKGGTFGGIYDATGSYVNNTIANNDSSQGEGVGLYSGAFINNIVIAKSGQTTISRSSSYLSNFSHNIIYAPSGSAYATGSPDQNGINGNITADPLLANPQQGHCGLLAGSPAIDAGDNTVPSPPATDFGSLLRLVDGNNDGTAAIDIGAYEFDPAYPVATIQGIPTGFLTSDALSITVSGAGVATYRFALDGGAFSGDTDVATPISLIDLANGQHTIVVLGKDAGGREQLPAAATAATWVVNAETTNLTFTYGGDAPWFIQPLVSRDGIAYQSGSITNDQSSWLETTVTGPGAIRFWWKVSSREYYGPLTFILDGVTQTSISGEVSWQSKAYSIPSGSHTLRWIYTADGLPSLGSNSGWLDQISFEQGNNLDIIPPTTTATPGGGMYAASPNVILTCTDTVGCTGTYYCLGSGCSPTTPFSGPIAVTSATDLRYYSTDAAGNSEDVKTARFTFDTTPPTSSPSLSAGTYSGVRDVELYCSDSGMGCATTYYCLGSGCTPTTPYTSAIAITASTDLRYYSADRGGNSETVKTATYTITPDTAPPTTTPSEQSGTYSNLYVRLFCSDGNGSDCTATYYCLGSGCTPTTRFTVSLPITSSTDLRFYSQDHSGNSEAIKTVSYTIDNTPPTTTVTPAGGIYTGAQNVTLACSDNSDCTATYYCLGKGCYPSTQYTGPISITSSTYLTFYSLDMASNRESTRTERYTILTAPAATINVPADQATIQAAIDTANDGDTVLVAPGTYVENINFRGKAITVTSSGGADVTTIDGNHAGTVVTFSTGEWYTSVLSGFTIRNGNAAWESPTYGRGGGIYIYVASPTILNNKIMQNQGVDGAGMYASGSPVIRGNLISENSRTAGWSGSFGGGGIYLCGESAQIVDNTISNNTMMEAKGGGIYLTCDGQNIVRGNVISHNEGMGLRGGGIYVDGFSVDHQIVQNLIVDNSASYGGGIYLVRGLVVANNTIAENSAFEGSGIYLDRYSWGSGLLTNNVIAGKAGQTAIYSESSSELNLPLRNNILFSSTNNVYGGTFSDQSGVNGNITADPRLNSARFGYYGLRPDSPAIDAGDSAATSLPFTDLNGLPRLIDGSNLGVARVDIGAYEFDPTEPRATVAGAPTGATRETTASITVGGTDIVSYRYALDGGAFTTTDTPVATPISLTGLAGGTHAVAVIGRTTTREQLASSATVAEWTIDTVPPVTTTTPASGTYAAAQTVTLTCDDGSGSGCAGTFYCLGGSCTPTTPYSGPITLAATTGLRFYSVDAFGHQEAIKTASFNFTGTISGTVSDNTGVPAQGVSVETYSSASGLFLGYGYTDSTGAYSITGLPSGGYKLRFSAAAYVAQWYNNQADRSSGTDVTVVAPNATTGINVALTKAGSITGTVTDSTTNGVITDVYVSAYHVVTGSWIGSAYTNSSGTYTIGGLAGGSYKLSFEKSNSGYLRQWYANANDLATATAVTVTDATTSGIDVALQTGGSISGTVTDSATGAGIPGVYVTAYDVATGQRGNSATTDSSGTYTIIGLKGNYQLDFSANGYVAQWYDGQANQSTANVVAVTAPNTTTGINAVLVKGATITGTITDSANGAAIVDASITAYDTTTGTWTSYGYTDSSGTYRITGLPTGSYNLRIYKTDYIEQWYGGTSRDTATAVVVAAPDTTNGIDAAIVKGSVITGTVTAKANGSALPWINVSVTDMDTGASGYGYTDSTGIYRISGLPTGNYKLRFSSSGTEYLEQWYDDKADSTTANSVAVTAPNTVTGIDAALATGATITGTVTDSTTGAPVPYCYIGAYKAASGLFVRSGNTDNTGSYRIAGLVTGNYKLKFSCGDYATHWYDGAATQDNATAVAATAPETTSGINATLTRAGKITGKVTDRVSGAGIRSTYLYLTERSTGEWAGSASTNENGEYTISGLASGTYRLRISPPAAYFYPGQWYNEQAASLCANDITVAAPDITAGIDVQLDQGGSISGRVTDVDTGFGIPGLSISYSSTSTSAWSASASNTIVDGTGAYTISGVPSGTYALFFNAPGYVSSSLPITTVTAPAATTGVDVALTKGGGISGRVTDSVTGAGINGVWVSASSNDPGAWGRGTTSDSNGNYVINGLPSGTYALWFDGSDADSYDTGYGRAWYQGETVAKVAASVTISAGSSPVTPSPAPVVLPTTTTSFISSGPVVTGSIPLSPSTPVSVTVPAVTTGINVSLPRMGGITGRIIAKTTEEPLDWIRVMVYDSINGAVVGSTITNSNGTYMVRGLPSGSYRVRYYGSSLGRGSYLDTWYGSGTHTTTQAEVIVTAPDATSGINAALAAGGGIAGSVSVAACPGPQQVTIKIYDATSGNLVNQTFVDTNYADRFTFGGLPAGSYKLTAVISEPGFQGQWYPSATDITTAAPLTVTAGSTTSGIAIQIGTGGGSISGAVTPGVTNLARPVKLFDGYSGGLVAETTAGFNGSFTLPGLADGTYKLLFAAHNGYLDQWYRVAGETATASPIVVSGGATITGINLAEPVVATGDLDGSGGSPDLADAIKIMRIAVGLDAVTPTILSRGDVAPIVDGVSTPDGIIDIRDALVILHRGVGLAW